MTLAVLGGTPRFSAPQHVGGPIVEEETRRRFLELTNDALDRNYLTNDGPFVRRLEEEVARIHRVKNAIFMNNGTLAQLVLVKAMGLPRGKALVGANTFISTPHVCDWLGLEPVFCDIDPSTLNLDVADFERKITPDAKVVIPTHVFGNMADVPEIVRVAGLHGVKVVVDAAHAFACDLGGVGPGGFGVPEFISFHATKYFSTIEGGAVVTNDDALAEEVRLVRSFGMTDPEHSIRSGINAKSSEISAAFGLASLPALEERRERLLEVRRQYVAALSGVPGLRVHDLDLRGRNNYRYFAVFIEEDFGVDCEAVYQAMRRENVLARRYFYPGCHQMEYYRDRRAAPKGTLPATDRAMRNILCLPTSYVGIDPREATASIASLLVEIHQRSGEVGTAVNS